MAIHVFIDGVFYKKYESAYEMNKENIGKVAISKSEIRDDGDHNLYMITINK